MYTYIYICLYININIDFCRYTKEFLKKKKNRDFGYFMLKKTMLNPRLKAGHRGPQHQYGIDVLAPLKKGPFQKGKEKVFQSKNHFLGVMLC